MRLVLSLLSLWGAAIIASEARVTVPSGYFGYSVQVPQSLVNLARERHWQFSSLDTDFLNASRSGPIYWIDGFSRLEFTLPQRDHLRAYFRQLMAELSEKNGTVVIIDSFAHGIGELWQMMDEFPNLRKVLVNTSSDVHDLEAIPRALRGLYIWQLNPDHDSRGSRYRKITPFIRAACLGFHRVGKVDLNYYVFGGPLGIAERLEQVFQVPSIRFFVAAGTLSSEDIFELPEYPDDMVWLLSLDDYEDRIHVANPWELSRYGWGKPKIRSQFRVNDYFRGRTTVQFPSGRYNITIKGAKIIFEKVPQSGGPFEDMIEVGGWLADIEDEGDEFWVPVPLDGAPFTLGSRSRTGPQGVGFGDAKFHRSIKNYARAFRNAQRCESSFYNEEEE